MGGGAGETAIYRASNFVYEIGYDDQGQQQARTASRRSHGGVDDNIDYVDQLVARLEEDANPAASSWNL